METVVEASITGEAVTIVEVRATIVARTLKDPHNSSCSINKRRSSCKKRGSKGEGNSKVGRVSSIKRKMRKKSRRILRNCMEKRSISISRTR